MKTTTSDSEYFSKKLEEFNQALKKTGVSGALRYLNQRTPHRFTGIYRFDGDTLRNIALFDKHEPEVVRGDDAPMADTYCSILRHQESLEIMDAAKDDRVKGKVITPVTSYCGAVMKDSDGVPFGTLCHFDMHRCQQRISDFPLLEACVQILHKHIFIEGKA